MIVEVETARLLGTVRANRTAHVEEFEETNERYRRAMRAWFLAQVREIESGHDFERYSQAPVPRSYAEGYDRAIGMLELHQSDTIDLGAQDYNELVKDDWNWKQEFAQTNASYAP